MSQLGLLPPGLLQQLVMGAQQVPPSGQPQLTMGAMPAPPTPPPQLAGLMGMGLGNLFGAQPPGGPGQVPAPAQAPPAPSLSQEIQNGPWRTTSTYTQGGPPPQGVDDIARQLRGSQPLGPGSVDLLMAQRNDMLHGGNSYANLLAASRQPSPMEQAYQVAGQQAQENRLGQLGMGNLGIAQQAENRQLVHGNQDLALKAQEFAQKMDPTYLSKQVGIQALMNGQTPQQAGYLQQAASKMLGTGQPSLASAISANPGGPTGAAKQPLSQMLDDLSYQRDASGQYSGKREDVGSFLWKLNNSGVDVPGNFDEIARYIKTAPGLGESALRQAGTHPGQFQNLTDYLSLGLAPQIRNASSILNKNSDRERGMSALRNLISQRRAAGLPELGQ
jgi:hypothetical protein